MLLAEAYLLIAHLRLEVKCLIFQLQLLILCLRLKVDILMLGEPQLIAEVAHSVLQSPNLILKLLLILLVS